MTHRSPSSPQQQGTTARSCELLASLARISVAFTGGRHSSSAAQGMSARKHSERPNLKALHWSNHEVRITGTHWAVETKRQSLSCEQRAGRRSRFSARLISFIWPRHIYHTAKRTVFLSPLFP